MPRALHGDVREREEHGLLVVEPVGNRAQVVDLRRHVQPVGCIRADPFPHPALVRGDPAATTIPMLLYPGREGELPVPCPRRVLGELLDLEDRELGARADHRHPCPDEDFPGGWDGHRRGPRSPPAASRGTRHPGSPSRGASLPRARRLPVAAACGDPLKAAVPCGQ